MIHDLKLDKFAGPLDLLLQLVEEQELDITEISLSQVTGQFFSFLAKLEKNRSEELADFLVIATKLIYLKSRHLLPYLYPEESDSGPSLAETLKMYKAYVDASKKIEELWQQGKTAYGHIEPPVKLKEFVLPANAGVLELRGAFEELLKRLRPIDPLPQVTIDHAFSIRQTIDKIRDWLKSAKRFSFWKVLSGRKNRTELIVGFLALLDMMAKKEIAVRQERSYAELEVERI